MIRPLSKLLNGHGPGLGWVADGTFEIGGNSGTLNVDASSLFFDHDHLAISVGVQGRRVLNGKAGFSGDGGSATQASLNSPLQVESLVVF